MESFRCSEVRWFEIDALPENTDEYIKEAVLNYKTNTAFTAFRL
jgi:hypothetical protein